MPDHLTYSDIRAAHDRIRGHVRPVALTPADPGTFGSATLQLALEFMQHTGPRSSFGRPPGERPITTTRSRLQPSVQPTVEADTGFYCGSSGRPTTLGLGPLHRITPVQTSSVIRAGDFEH